MNREKGFTYASNSNLHMPARQHDIHETDLKTMASNVLHNRLKSHNQLQSFYMPYLKKAFEDSKSTNPSLKSPEQLIFGSKLLEIKETEDKLQIDLLKKEIESKNNKIIKLENRVKLLEQNMLVYNRSPPLENRIEEPYVNLKRMEEYMQIKNDQYLFRAKMRASALLQDFNIHRSEIEILNLKRSQAQILDYVMDKIKPLGVDYRSLRNINYQRRSELESKHIRLEYEAKQLQQSLELMANTEKSLRQQLEHVKQNWNNSNSKIVSLERQLEQKDTEIFRLKKTLEEKSQNLKHINKETDNKISIETNLRIDHEKQANDMALLLQSSYVDNLTLKEKLEQKEFEYSELKVAYEFNQEELDRINRINVILKSRYEPEENKVGFSYSPRPYEESDMNKFTFSKILSFDERKKSQEPITISKQRVTNSEFPLRSNKLRLERVVELRKGIEERELELWRLQAKASPHMVFSRETTPEIQKLQYQIEVMRQELLKLESDISTKTRNN